MKILILLFSGLCTALSLYSQEQEIKFYLLEGGITQYKIEDIMKLTFINSNLSYSMTIFQKGSEKTNIDTRVIDSIIFVDDQIMKIHLPKESKTYEISSIDSVIFVFNTCSEIQIGTQKWMCKNLDVDHYRNGDSIPQVTDPNQWKYLTTGAWCYFNNDPVNGEIYGKMYNWYAVNDMRGLAPDGWHVPTDEDWTELENYLGGSSEAGGKLKSTGTKKGGDGLWRSPNTGATNESGFTALPGGWRDISGEFRYLGEYGMWWSSSVLDATMAWGRNTYFNSTYLNKYFYNKGDGCFVRCIKD